MANLPLISRIKGLSLVEVMISLGVIGIGAAALMSLQTQMSKSNSRQNNLSDFQNLVSTLYGILSNQNACKTALNTKSFNPTALTPQSPQAIAGGITYNGISFTPGQTFNSIKIDSLQWVSPASSLGASSEMINGVATNLNSYQANLEVKASNINQKLNPGSYSRTLTFIVSIDGSNQIRSCFSTIDGGAVCSQLGGTLSNGRCNLTIQSNSNVSVGDPCSPIGSTQYRPGSGIYICGPSGYELIESKDKCSTLGGRTVTFGSLKLCKVTGGSCPPGMTRYQNWSTTQANSGCGGSTSGCNSGDCCTTGSHGFGNAAQESCYARRNVACGPAKSGGSTIWAIVTEVGCQ